MHVFNVGGLKSFGVLFQELQRKFSASSSELAGVYSLSSFLMFALGKYLLIETSLFELYVQHKFIITYLF